MILFVLRNLFPFVRANLLCNILFNYFNDAISGNLCGFLYKFLKILKSCFNKSRHDKNLIQLIHKSVREPSNSMAHCQIRFN